MITVKNAGRGFVRLPRCKSPWKKKNNQAPKDSSMVKVLSKNTVTIRFCLKMIGKKWNIFFFFNGGKVHGRKYTKSLNKYTPVAVQAK